MTDSSGSKGDLTGLGELMGKPSGEPEAADPAAPLAANASADGAPHEASATPSSEPGDFSGFTGIPGMNSGPSQTASVHTSSSPSLGEAGSEDFHSTSESVPEDHPEAPAEPPADFNDFPDLGAITAGAPEGEAATGGGEAPAVTENLVDLHEQPLGSEIPASPPEPPRSTLDALKNFSEKAAPGRNLIPAAFPFSLMIEGSITPHEREKILDILAREKMGITEVDLEPQFESGRVLIPRISEYAGILLVQALRAIQARMRLAPSDSIFSTVDTRDSAEETQPAADERATRTSPDPGHPAESLPLTRERGLPNVAQFQVIDTITVSAVLKTTVVDAEQSSEYQEVLEGLSRELKYKAHYRGASAITQFSVHLVPLGLASHYRLSVMGLAIRPQRPATTPRA